MEYPYYGRLRLAEIISVRAGELFGDRGYISQELFEKLYEQGLELITKYKKKMKQKLVKLVDKILLRKRSFSRLVKF